MTGPLAWLHDPLLIPVGVLANGTCGSYPKRGRLRPSLAPQMALGKTPHPSWTSVHFLPWTWSTSVLIIVPSALVCGRNPTLPKAYITPFVLVQSKGFSTRDLRKQGKKRLTSWFYFYAASHFAPGAVSPGSVTDGDPGEECWLLFQKYVSCTLKLSSTVGRCQTCHIYCLLACFHSIIL